MNIKNLYLFFIILFRVCLNLCNTHLNFIFLFAMLVNSSIIFFFNLATTACMNDFFSLCCMHSIPCLLNLMHVGYVNVVTSYIVL